MAAVLPSQGVWIVIAWVCGFSLPAHVGGGADSQWALSHVLQCLWSLRDVWEILLSSPMGGEQESLCVSGLPRLGDRNFWRLSHIGISVFQPRGWRYILCMLLRCKILQTIAKHTGKCSLAACSALLQLSIYQRTDHFVDQWLSNFLCCHTPYLKNIAAYTPYTPCISACSFLR